MMSLLSHRRRGSTAVPGDAEHLLVLPHNNTLSPEEEEQVHVQKNTRAPRSLLLITLLLDSRLPQNFSDLPLS